MTPTSIAALLAARVASDPARPMLTFYDDATGERTELSAATLDNWVAKTANLLVDGLGLGPGGRVLVDLPGHWQTAVVLLACWTCGLEVVIADGPARPAAPVDAAFVAEGAAMPDADELVVLSLRPFGKGLSAPVGGAVDYAADVATYGDRFGSPSTGPGQAALIRTATEVASSCDIASTDRILTSAGFSEPAGLLGGLLLPLVCGASAVLCRNLDPSSLARRCATERVTAIAGSLAGDPGDGVRHLALP